MKSDLLDLCVLGPVAGLNAEDEIKQIIGAWYRRHRTDASLWPPALREWVEETKPHGGILTQEDLLEWMHKETGLDTLLSRTSLVAYRRIERWADGRDFGGSLDNYYHIYTATQSTGFLTLPLGGDRVRDGLLIAKVISGQLDPFTGLPRPRRIQS